MFANSVARDCLCWHVVYFQKGTTLKGVFLQVETEKNADMMIIVLAVMRDEESAGLHSPRGLLPIRESHFSHVEWVISTALPFSKDTLFRESLVFLQSQIFLCSCSSENAGVEWRGSCNFSLWTLKMMINQILILFQSVSQHGCDSRSPKWAPRLIILQWPRVALTTW